MLVPNTVSDDGVAIVGLEDTLFIYRGGNDLLGSYQDEDVASAQQRASSWTDLSIARHAKCIANGMQFQQIVVPEKSSVIPELFPFDIKPETLLFRKVDEKLKLEAANIYVSLLDELRHDISPRDIFRRYDSHLSPYGAQKVSRHILQRLGEKLPPLVSFDKEETLLSDLGSKFPGSPLLEKVWFPNLDEIATLYGHPVHLHLEETPGNHIGTVSVWGNANAPLQKTAVSYANSFFERGFSPSSLSWWAARYFKEFHFVWSPRMDVDYLRRVGADICLCQTVERFLSIIPPC